MKPRFRIVGLLAAAVAVAGSIAVFVVVGQGAGVATTTATFQVNPAFSVTLNADRNIVEVIPHDGDVRRLLEGTELKGVALEEAVVVLTNKLTVAGHLPENNVAVAVHPTGNGTKQDAAAVANVLEASLSGAVAEDFAVTVVTLSKEDFLWLEDNGLLPGDYANIVADAGTIESIRALLAISESNGTDGELLSDRFGTIVEALNEMVGVGISQGDALGLIEAAVTARFDLENISELADVHEELTNIGLSGTDALALIMQTIPVGLSTDDMWDIADLHLEFRERGMSFEDVQAFISAQIAAGWNADRVDEYADRFEARRAADGEDPYAGKDYDQPPTPADAGKDYDQPPTPADDDKDYDQPPTPVTPPTPADDEDSTNTNY